MTDFLTSESRDADVGTSIQGDVTLQKRQSLWIERGLIEDLVLAVRQRRVARMLYMAEIAESRRSTGLGLFGPFLSTALHMAVLGTVMSMVFAQPMREFIPYFGLSFAIWQTLSAAIGRMANASERAVRFLAFPRLSSLIIYMVDAYDYVLGLSARLLSALVVIAIVNHEILMSANFPAFAVGMLLASVVVIIWSPIATVVFNNFRILRGFLPQILLLVFLITPVFYSADRFSEHRWVADFNPVYHLIEVVRAPVIDGNWPAVSLAVCIGLVLGGLVLLRIVHRRQRLAMVYGWIA
ncbi:ABC transporter permease [Rhizobium sp. CSW-27]|uniref:ABC transporter permease n=1 Tax=Rhizobium sp. CSW-27 TaxID=2839985 RepID=UPI001C037F7B|nr:ABC transporter permease [Rhizobium sp. CSW-27]MBT9370035.1 ABC transporter permease [Rhizobium sp. CSW-27]